MTTRYIDAGAVSIYYGRANGKILGNPDVRLLPEGDLNAVSRVWLSLPRNGYQCRRI